jgi:hypothetical protein
LEQQSVGPQQLCQIANVVGIAQPARFQTVIPLDAELAINAATYGLSYKLPLADSIIFATARKYAATIWTQDRDFKGLSKVRFYPKAKHAQVIGDSRVPRHSLQMTGSPGASAVPEAGVSVRGTGAP